jgi:hypothetical protein
MHGDGNSYFAPFGLRADPRSPSGRFRFVARRWRHGPEPTFRKLSESWPQWPAIVVALTLCQFFLAPLRSAASCGTPVESG